MNCFPPELINRDLQVTNLANAHTKMDSGPTIRRRPRDPSSLTSYDQAVSQCKKPKLDSGFDSFVDHQNISQIYNQQEHEIDRYLAQHAEKLRAEIEERERRQGGIVMRALQEGVIKKLKGKDEVIQRMGELNWALQERVESMYVENQIWRDLAQTNEAAANSLRTDLEQVLGADAESSSGGDCEGETGDEACGGGVGSRMCKRCGVRESSVLLLPCRHLCLCTICGSTLLGTCPVCDSVMNASVHVNMS